MSKKTNESITPVCRRCGSELVSVPMDIGAYDWLCPVCELGSGPETNRKDLRKLLRWITHTYGSKDKMLTLCWFNQIQSDRELGRDPDDHPKALLEMAQFEMRDYLDSATYRNRWWVSHKDVWDIVENAHVLDYPPEAWCTNCGVPFREDDLELFEEDTWYFKGCPNCKTDGYLRYFDELPEDLRVELLKKWNAD